MGNNYRTKADGTFYDLDKLINFTLQDVIFFSKLDKIQNI